MRDKGTIRQRLKVSLNQTNAGYFKGLKYFSSSWVLKNLHTLIHQLQELQGHALSLHSDDWDELLDNIIECATIMKGMSHHQHGMFHLDYKHEVWMHPDTNTLAKF